MTWFKKIYLVLLVWVLVIFGAFCLLFGTNFGTNLIFRGFAYSVPELTFDSVSGHWGDFNITNLSYEIPSGMIKVHSFHISINLRYILFKQINVEQFYLKDVFIETKKTFIDSNEIDNNQTYVINNIIKYLYPIFIKDMVLDNVNIILNNIEFRFQKISSGLTLCDNLLKVLPTYIKEGIVINKFSIGELFNIPDISIIRNMLCSQDSLNIKIILKSIAQGITKLIKHSIPIDVIFSDIQGERIFIYNNCGYDNCNSINHFQIRTFWNKEVAYIKLGIDFPHGNFNGIGNITLNDGYPVNIVASYVCNNSITHNYKHKSSITNIKFIVTGSLVDTVSIRFEYCDIVSAICILLNITLKDFSLPIELIVTGKSIPVFMFKKNKYILEEFNLYLIGKLYTNYCVKVQSKVHISNRNIACISLCAQGDVNNFTISELKLEILEGYCKMKGVVDWKKIIRWNNTLVFNKINIFKKYLRCPIVLSGKITTQGYLSSDSWKLIVSEFCCYGNIKNNELKCHGSIYVGSNKELSIPMFFIHWGDNRLEIQGDIQKNQFFNIVLRLKLINCASFLSKLNSDIIGYCKVYGLVNSPEFSLKIDINSLNWYDPDINIARIVVRSNFCYKNLMQGNFDIKVYKIQHKNLVLHKLCVQGQGKLNEYGFNICICSEKELLGLINCILEFDSKNKMWNGRISKTKIFTPMGTWELMQDIEFIYHNISKKITVKSHRWKNVKCRGIFSSNIQEDIFEKINLISHKSFGFIFSDIVLMELISVHDINISCTDINWVISNKFLPQGNICLSSSRIDIKYANQQDVPVVVADDMDIHIKLTKTNLFFCCIVNINENQNIMQCLITDLYNTPKVMGIIKIKNILLNSICQFLLKSRPCIYGAFSADINFKGYLDCPKIFGVLKLEDVSINNSNIPFAIANGILEINCFGNSAVLHGKINTEHASQLFFNGEITNINSIRHMCMLLKMTGKQIDINISPVIYAKVSFNLVCSMTLDKINFTGDIIVSQAEITVQEFSKNIVETSSDELIVDEQYRPILNKYKNCSVLVSSIFNIYLEDDVNFNGFGLHAKLQGNLEMIYNQSDFTLMGYVNIFSGYVEMYGQNLMIKKGQLLFSGSINQTYVDIETVRNPIVFSHIKDSVTAGIRITGLLNQLKLDFFSDSSLLSQQEIMSYLFGGYNSIFSDTNDANMITSLLIGVSMQRYEKLIDKIGEILGIQDLKLSTQNFEMPSLITLSGYITPGIQVQYGISIVNLLKNTITIRCRIYPQLYMEAKSDNDTQSLDLLYRFSFN